MSKGCPGAPWKKGWRTYMEGGMQGCNTSVFVVVLVSDNLV